MNQAIKGGKQLVGGMRIIQVSNEMIHNLLFHQDSMKLIAGATNGMHNMGDEEAAVFYSTPHASSVCIRTQV